MGQVIPKGIPFAQIPWEVIEDSSLTASAFRVYCYLMRRANSESRAWPSHRTIAAATNVNKSTVAAAISQLVDEQWIEVHVESDQDPTTGHKQRHSYTLYGTRPARLFTVDRSDKPTGRINQPVGLSTQTVRIEDPDRTDEPYITTTNELQPELQPEEVAAPQPRRRDLLWEQFVAVHGDPATKSERGKFNRIVAKLREASVTPDEYPTLVAAFASKNAGLQPAPATIAERVGELRNYVRRGPVRALDADELAQKRAFAELEAAHALGGGS